MNKTFKRVLCLVLSICAVLSLTACGGGGSRRPGPNKGGETKVEAVTFPLEEPMEFTFMIQGVKSASFDEQIANNALIKKLEKETNVHINWQFVGNDTTKLNLLMSSGDYGDVIFGGPILNSVTASKYIAAGKIQELTPYMTEELMPEFMADLAENPDMMCMITASDGKAYCLPKITGLEGQYLESPIWINKKWLDNLGLQIPTTTDELIEVLKAFRDRDPNGNGLPDEIPYLACTDHAQGNLEPLAGIFGIATKDGVNDAFVQVVDGKVTFAPLNEGYKDYIKFMRTLYTENLLWSEAFIASTATYSAKLTSSTPLVGMFTLNNPLETDYVDDYVCILPPKAEGYEPCWYFHPAINGSKNQFYVTDKCENVSVLMAYMDRFFNLENSLLCDFGALEEGRFVMQDGKYTVVEMDSVEATKLGREYPTFTNLTGNSIRSFTAKDYATVLNLSPDERVKQDCYILYADIVNKEIWPRPYYAPEVCNEADLYVTDINLAVTQRRGSWITGRVDVDADWDKFISDLNRCGLQEYLVILQDAYDAYLAGNKQ